MAKVANIDKEFNSEKYAELLKKAKGNRTLTQFAKACDLSLSYLCKYINDSYDKPPMASTVEKIAQNAENNVSYAELLDAAGYDTKKYITEQSSTIKIDSISLAVATISTALIRQNRFKWSLLEGNGEISSEPFSKSDSYQFDFSISVQDDLVSVWYFDIINQLSGETGEIPDYKKSDAADKIRKRVIKMLLDTQEKNCKVSLVTANPHLFEFIKTVELSPAFAVFVSAVLIDTSSLRVIKEEYLKTALIDRIDEIKSFLI